MARVFLTVLDSAGCGGAPDAADFGDEGANTLGHIVAECAAGRADQGRKGPLFVPHLDALGLGAAIRLASGMETPGLNATPTGRYGAATEVSLGKDTPSGHWEIAGLPVPWDWHYFPDETPAFPDEIVAEVCRLSGATGILANSHASGIPVIEAFGQQHIETGQPICYTSVDSVFQIAAHEEAFGLERLYQLCRDLAPMLHQMKVGRVIARPFVGSAAEGFQRTTNRRDFAIEPPSDTLCDFAAKVGRKVYAVGKINDIFSGRGISSTYKGKGDASLMAHLTDLVASADDGSLIFANFVEFDTLYGHQRDVAGYARALEWFDQSLPGLFTGARPGDIFMFTADHGNDPTWRGTDHTRERVPVLVHGAAGGEIGHCSLSDIGASAAKILGIPFGPHGRSFL